MEKIVFEGTEQEITNLKALINGIEFFAPLPKMREDYQTGNLWSVADMEGYDCTREQALEVLEQALTNDATMEQIWYAIHFHAEEMGLKRIDEDEDED